MSQGFKGMQWEHTRTNFDRNLAVVIGIDRYDSRGIHDLQTAVSDANAIANLLRDEYGYKDEHIVRLFSPKNDEATLKALNQPYRPATLDELRLLLTDTLPNHLKPTPADRLLFYFAGHGIPRNSKDGPAGYLVPQTAQQGNPDSFLPMRELHDALSKLECHHLLVILDCCFAGTFRWASSRKAIPILETVHKEHYDRFIRYPAWQVLTSAAHDQEALDLSIDQRGSAIKDTKHSPFALALIEGLRDNKADVIQDKVITAHELYLYLDRRVNELSREMQTPGIYPMRLDYDRGEYIFTRSGFKRDDLTEAPPLNEENNPYRGLKPFEQRHSRFFFGRKALVEALSQHLAQSHRPLTVVLGASGSGKSSLVKAGLLPYLRGKQEKDEQAQRWYILDPIRPGKSPFRELARTLLPVANSNLIAQLAQVSFLDKAFAEILDPNSEQKRKTTSPNPTQLDSREGLSGDEAFDATKLAECWNHAEPEAKLLLVVDYFAQLQGFCHQPQEQEQLSSLYRAIEQTLNRLTQALQQEPQSFTDLMAIWSQDNPSTKLLLVIDQFEELITMSQDEPGGGEQSDSQEQDEQKEWQHFLSLLRMALAKYRRQLHVVLTLRSDFEPRFLNSALKAHWKSARFPVRAMNSDELRDAIERPALKQALYFEPPELVGKLIDEVGQMPGALPLLSFTLSELYIKLYERWTKDKSTDRALRIKDYEELGGVAGALTRRATQEYDNLVRDFGETSGKAYQATMRRVMLRMVAIEGGGVARRRVPESELVYSDVEENKRVVQVIDRLVKARLLVKGQETGEPYVEPAHDFLVRGWDKLQEWIKEEQGNLVLRQRLASAANAWIKKTGSLWVEEAARLVELNVVIKSDNNWLNRLEAVFVKRSSKVRQDRIKKLEEDLRISEQRRARAELREKASRIQHLLSVDPLEGLTLAIETTGQNLHELSEEILTSTQDSLYKAMQVAKIPLQIVGRGSFINSSTFSANEQIIASASNEKTIYLWSIKGELIKQISQFFRVDNESKVLAFSPRGKMIISDGISLELWDLEDHLICKILPECPGRLASVTFSSDEQLVAIAIDSKIQLWDMQGNLVSQLDLSDDKGFLSQKGILSIAFSPKAHIIVGGGFDGAIKIWDLNGEVIEQQGHEGWITSVAFSPDGQWIASGSDDKTVRLWNLDGQPIAHSLELNDKVSSVAFSPDGNSIAVGGDHSVLLWNFQEQINSLSFEPSQEDFIIWLFQEGDGYFSSVSFSSDGRMLLGTSGEMLFLWNLEGNLLHCPFQAQEDSARVVAFNPDEGTLVSGGDTTIRLWDFQGNLITQASQSHEYALMSIAFSHDGKILVSCSLDKTVCWNLQDTSDLQILCELEKGGTSVAFRPDCNTVFIGRESEIICWKLHKGFTAHHLQKLDNDTDGICITFSPDCQKLVSGSYHGTVSFWNVDGNLVKRNFQAHDRPVMSAAFSPNGQVVATSGSRIIRLWDKEGNPIGQPFRKHQSSIYAIAFSSDGQMVVSGDGDGKVQFWDFQGNPIGQPLCGYEAVRSIAFSPDGQIIASGSNRGRIQLWLGGWEAWLQACCDRLRYHPVFTNPESIENLEQREIAISACKTCHKYVWNESDSTPT